MNFFYDRSARREDRESPTASRRRRAERRRRMQTPSVEHLEPVVLLSSVIVPYSVASTASGPEWLSPQLIDQAYGFNQAPASAYTGTGTTIAIIDFTNDPTIASDLHAFDTQFGLPAANLTVESASGSTTQLPTISDPAYEAETSLDVEWAHAIAPGANILLIEDADDPYITPSTPQSQITTYKNDVLQCVNPAASTPGVVAVSMSFGFAEGSGDVANNADFTAPSGHVGIEFVASTGDYGEDTPREFPSGGAMWPSASPNVLAVGGSTLTVTSNGTYVSEEGWTYNDGNPSENADGSSNGGPSAVQAEPQAEESVQTSGVREVPDVAYDAGNAVDVYDSSYPGGPWVGFGGTSAGAPQWAALIARVDQGRLANGEAALQGIAPFYALPTSAYHVITTGSNWTTTTYTGAPYVSQDYNMVTGRGTPIANQMIAVLADLTLTAGQSIESPNGQFRLIMQTDGNLVEYGPGNQIVWDSGTAGTNAGDYAVMQTDGNLVVYSSAGRALWDSGTGGNYGAHLQLQNDGVTGIYKLATSALIWSGNDVALPGRVLTAGQMLYSSNVQYQLIMQGDGNLVEYGPGGQVIWDSGTNGNSGAYAIMQTDGNLVVHSATGQVLWNSGTYGNYGAYLRLQNNGVTGIYQLSTNALIWSGNDVALPGRVLTAGQELYSSNVQYLLAMQTDGNLVEYGPGSQVIWDSGTNGHPGDYAVMQTDGNLVVYSSTGQPLWDSGTNGNAGAYFQLQNNGNAVIYQANGTALWYCNSIAVSGRIMTAGQAIYSPNGQYDFVMQADGNLVEYGPGNQAIWASGTNGHPGAFAAMQGDGNLVVYSSTGQALWASGTQGHPGAYLVLNDEGVLEIVYEGTVIWSV